MTRIHGYTLTQAGIKFGFLKRKMITVAAGFWYT